MNVYLICFMTREEEWILILLAIHTSMTSTTTSFNIDFRSVAFIASLIGIARNGRQFNNPELMQLDPSLIQ